MNFQPGDRVERTGGSHQGMRIGDMATVVSQPSKIGFILKSTVEAMILFILN